MPDTCRIGQRALNRALLDRQLLLRRADLSVPDVLHLLVGMQAQAPNAPYVGLWTRLAGFRAEQLAEPIILRAAVRATAMRATIHLLNSGDLAGPGGLRDLLRPMLFARWSSSPFARNLAGLDVDEVVAAGRQLLEERPRTRVELSHELGERWPERDPASLAYATTFCQPTVQIPPRGIWGDSGPPTYATVDGWLGGPPSDGDGDGDGEPADRPGLGGLVLRYLAGFGPASVRDVQAWCGLTRLACVVDELRPRLRTFRDERGVELFDLPDAPRPDPDVPAPPRFLPEYDNLLLSHADRARVIPDNRRVPLPPGNGGTTGTVLVDGFLRATWRIRRDGDRAVLSVQPDRALPAGVADEVAAEGALLLSFAAAGAGRRDVRVSSAP